MRRRLAAPGRLRWASNVGASVVDQALSSATQLLLLLTVAHTSSAAVFGAASGVTIVFGLLLGAQRAGVGDVALLRSRREGADRREVASAAVAAAGFIGLVFALPQVVVGVLIGGTVGPLLVMLGVLAPATCAQDMVRSIAYGQLRVGRAVEVDGIWLAVQAGVTGALLVTDRADVTSLFAAWGSGAAVSAVWGIARVAAPPRLAALRRWWAEDAPRAKAFVADYASDSGVVMVANLALGLVLGPESFGILRLAITSVVPPVNLMGSARSLSLARIGDHRDRPASAARVAHVTAIGFFALAAGYGAVLFVMPVEVGEAVFGDSWDRARWVALVFACGEALRFSSLPAIDLVRVLGRPSVLVRTRIAVTTCGVVASLGGAWAFGLGVIWAIVAARVVGAAVWWWRGHQVTTEPAGRSSRQLLLDALGEVPAPTGGEHLREPVDRTG